jgi:glycosyltransferase involved in cell wall biosynthesis
MEAPILSVVVPVFNGESYILQALDVLARATGAGIEVVIVDDGSTDRSGQIIRDHPGSGSWILVTGPNRGLGAARNAGLQVASGSYVAFLDADDRFDLDAYVAMASEAMLSGVHVARGAFAVEDWEGTRVRIHEVPSGMSLGLDVAVQTPCVPRFIFATAFLRRESLHFENVRYAEDLGFHFRVMRRVPRVLNHRAVVYLYRSGRSGSLTQSRVRLSEVLLALDKWSPSEGDPAAWKRAYWFVVLRALLGHLVRNYRHVDRRDLQLVGTFLADQRQHLPYLGQVLPRLLMHLASREAGLL